MNEFNKLVLFWWDIKKRTMIVNEQNIYIYKKIMITWKKTFESINWIINKQKNLTQVNLKYCDRHVTWVNS
jgi:hypothetical protein